MAKRKNYSPDFKAKVALAALSNEKTVAELSMEHGVHQNLINKWKAQLKKSAAGVFSGSIKKEDSGREQELRDLHAKIGQLIVERDFLAKAWEKR